MSMKLIAPLTPRAASFTTSLICLDRIEPTTMMASTFFWRSAFATSSAGTRMFFALSRGMP